MKINIYLKIILVILGVTLLYTFIDNITKKLRAKMQDRIITISENIDKLDTLSVATVLDNYLVKTYRSNFACWLFSWHDYRELIFTLVYTYHEPIELAKVYYNSFNKSLYDELKDTLTTEQFTTIVTKYQTLF